MDPITAFSLACGAAQLVQFAVEAAQTCAEIQKSTSGLSAAHHELESRVERLKSLAAGIETSASQQASTATLRGLKSGVTIAKLSKDCTETAANLIALLDELKATNSAGLPLSAVKAAIKAICKKGKSGKVEETTGWLPKRIGDSCPGRYFSKLEALPVKAARRLFRAQRPAQPHVQTTGTR